MRTGKEVGMVDITTRINVANVAGDSGAGSDVKLTLFLLPLPLPRGGGQVC